MGFGGGFGGFVSSVVAPVANIISPASGVVGGALNAVGSVPIIGGGLQSILGTVGSLPIAGDLLGPGGLNLLQQRQRSVLDAIPDISKPSFPEFSSLRNASGMLPSQYQLAPNTQAIDQLRSQVQGASPWSAMRMGELDANKLTQRASIQNAPLVEQAKSMAAMRGGIGQSGINQLQRTAGLERAGAFADINAQDRLGRLNILSQAEEARQKAMGQLPGLEQQMLAPQKFNVQTALAEKTAKDQSDMTKFREEMRAWAARQTGKSIADSGKK